ncbi:MAG: low-specificity L-threonine aldolase [Planctomycetota bacterium]|nr:MAG: low-specificity L-threonine aldolase [Planctomycetota bacterium]
MFDLKSDTITKPTKLMLEAMFNASVGDDVFDEDPTVRALEDKSAELLHKEAALFVPSGTQSNLIATMLHTPPGSEMIVDNNSHIQCYEAGGSSRFGGLTLATTDNPRGNINIQDIEDCIKPDNIHYTNTTSISIENTHNRKGGTIYPKKEVANLFKFAKTKNLKLHIDGARIWNAVIAENSNITDFSENCDSITFCLSKGLGCPVGSVLLGTKDFIYEAKRLRKALGGGMRQIGYLAAAGIYALDNNIERLQEDHSNAILLSNTIRDAGLIVNQPESNIVIWEPQKQNVPETIKVLTENGILGVPFGDKVIRFVTHLNHGIDDIKNVCEILKKIL